MTITRYTIGCAGGMVEDPAGEYVRYADVVTGDSAIVAIAEVNRLIAADNVLTWLEQNVTHLEHGDPGLEDGYWPHTAEDVDPFCNFIGLTLGEYVRKRQAGEVGRHADPEPEYEPDICGTCAGSGEGMWDGSTCPACRGRGEVLRRAA